jgi:DNA-binding NtrC family response regulator
MISILLVSSDNRFFPDLSSNGTNRSDLHISRAGSGEKALLMISGYPYALVVVDERLSDMTGLTLVKKVVLTNPMINCAVVSHLSEDAFHEASEGLGILMQLSPDPTDIHAKELLGRLDNILNLAGKTG